jgi:hypothetical protein
MELFKYTQLVNLKLEVIEAENTLKVGITLPQAGQQATEEI